MTGFVSGPDKGGRIRKTDCTTAGGAKEPAGQLKAFWGGLVTGDEVSVHWESDCACGRQGPSIDRAIGSYSEKRGGDDKISCAETQEAHNRAIEHLANI